MEFEAVIGLEVHLQLSTATKIFTPSSAAFGGDPNEFVDPVTLGLPGALPVLNRRVVEYGVMCGLALNCEIRRFNRFARKHYFYPDLPKGYQISQYEEPICERGHITIHVDEAVRTVGIKRVHMEEDAGKNIHDSRTSTSLVDLNRAGVPLLEIVSEADLRSPSEAGAYLKTIRQIARYLKISDGNMEEGSLRCDANISLRPVGTLKFGTRTEIKNLNSFKFVEKALEYEIARQYAVLKGGKEVLQETLHFDPASGTTRSLRSKEESAEYRYFPDPDLPPLVIEQSFVEEIKALMPKLPEQRSKELIEVHGLTAYDAAVLTSERSIVDYYDEVFKVCANAKAASNWVTSELFGLLNKNGLPIEKTPVSAADLGALIKLVDSEAISGKMAKTVFEEMFLSGRSPQTIVQEKGLKQITSPEEVMKLIQAVFQQNAAQLNGFIAGDDRLHGFFVGQVMKASGGKANPKMTNDLVRDEIIRLRNKS